MGLNEFLKQLRDAAEKSGIIKKEEALQIGFTRVKMRYLLIDGSYVDVFTNVVLDKQYYHWQKADGKIYRVNNFPAEGWHERIDFENKKKPCRKITPYEFFDKVKKEIEKQFK